MSVSIKIIRLLKNLYTRVITGEGKMVCGVSEICKKQSIPVIAVIGTLNIEEFNPHYALDFVARQLSGC